MIHGDKTRFAIQWELNSDHAGHWLLGKVCFWIGGMMVGDYDSGATLSDVLVELKYPVGDCGNRRSERFCKMEPGDAFATIHAGLHEYEEPLSSIVDDESWARFDVLIPVDVLVRWELYLFDCDVASRLLVGHYAPGSEKCVFQMEQRLRVGEYDQIITEFQSELDAAQRPHLHKPLKKYVSAYRNGRKTRNCGLLLSGLSISPKCHANPRCRTRPLPARGRQRAAAECSGFLWRSSFSPQTRDVLQRLPTWQRPSRYHSPG
jgi:immunity protein 42 of polymorphic toxin system